MSKFIGDKIYNAKIYKEHKIQFSNLKIKYNKIYNGFRITL